MEFWELLTVKVLLESQDSLLLDVEGHQHLLSPQPPAYDGGQFAVDPKVNNYQLSYLDLNESETKELIFAFYSRYLI